MVCFVRRFIHNARNSPQERKAGTINGSEWQDSLNFLIKREQEKHYPEEISNLLDGSPIPRTSPIWRLKPCLRGGHNVLCLNPRTKETPLPIVPPRSHLAELIITHVHGTLLHQGATATLANIRTRFWIPKGQALVKRLVRRCPQCWRFFTLPFAPPEAALTDFRSKSLKPW